MVKKRKKDQGTTFLIVFVAAIIIIGILSFVKVPYTDMETITTQEEQEVEVPYTVHELREVEETYYDQVPVVIEECVEEEFEYEILHPGDIQHEGLVTGYIKKDEEYRTGLQYIEWRYWTGYYQIRPNGGKYYQSAVFCNLEQVPAHYEADVCFYYDDVLVECPYHFKMDLSRRFCKVFTGLIWISTYDEKRDIRMMATYIPTHQACEEVTKMVNQGAPKTRTVTKAVPITKYRTETKIVSKTEEIEIVKYRSLIAALFNKT